MMARRASSGLKALCCSGWAPSSSRSAAMAKLASSASHAGDADPYVRAEDEDSDR